MKNYFLQHSDTSIARKQNPTLINLKFWPLTVMVIFLFSFNGFTQSYTGYSNNPAGNDGLTEAKAIHIYTVGDLIYLSHTPADLDGKYFIQMADIDFGVKEGVDWDNDGSANWDTEDQLGFLPIGQNASDSRFKGSYDGNHKSISDLYVNRPSYDGVGLFGQTLGYTGTKRYLIQNIYLINCHIVGKAYVGGIVGNNSCDIRNCHVQGTIEGSENYIGGIAGNSGFPITYCSTSATVSGNGRVGGLAGDGSTLKNCYTTGLTISSNEETGGIVGFLRGTAINCYATGAVIASNPYDYTGGIAGKNTGTITHCYSTGVVSGMDGFTGGLIGQNYTGIVNESYFDRQTTGQTTKIGMYENNQADNITILNTVDFKNNSICFKDWDTNEWSFDAEGRPYLSWQKVAVSNFSVSNNGIVGHVVKDAEVVLSETGVRYSPTTLPLNWSELSMTDANSSISIDLASHLTIDSEYFVQTYAEDDNNNVYFGDMVKAKLYRVTYDSNGGTSGSITEEIVTKGESSTLSGNPVKEGYYFNGWRTGANGTGSALTTSTVINGSITVYAQWLANSYEVIFNPNGGIGTMNNQTVTYDATTALSINTYSKPGYAFAGWSDTAEGNVVYTDGANYAMSTGSNVTLYAIWDITIGVGDQDMENISIYPNPVSDILTLRVDRDCMIELLDLTGRIICKRNINSSIDYLDMKKQISGTYMLRIIHKSGIITKKIVKK